jgi:hypothetical protein
MPVKDYVRTKLETEKEKQLLEEIVAANNIQVPADFDVPEVTEEQLQQMKQKQQQQQQMPPELEPDGEIETEPADKPAKPAPKKPEAKKK